MLFSQIPGHKAEKQRLIQTVADNRISHAQLFMGQEGAGALPMAIAYAQYIACENKQAGDSCGQCPSCLKFNKLAHPDLHFVFPTNTTSSVKKHPTSDKFLADWREALTQNPFLNLYDWLEKLGIENKQGNINVEESSEILKKLSLKSFEGEYKTVIIWKAERMNGSSANKLLKIIEEPPAKTLFILITESQEAILPTILSRTQLVKVNALTEPEIAEGLTARLGLEENAAKKVAHMAEGSFREALLLSRETEERDFYEREFIQWMRMCIKKDIVQITPWVDEISRIGRERQKRFLSFGLRIFHESLLINYGASNPERLEQGLAAFLKKFAPFFNEANCLQFTEAFNQALAHIERNANARILFLDLSIKVIQYLLTKPVVR